MAILSKTKQFDTDLALEKYMCAYHSCFVFEYQIVITQIKFYGYHQHPLERSGAAPKSRSTAEKCGI
jgi:hypothetical protein